MTRSKGSGKPDKRPRGLKWLAAAIPLMAAAVPVIGLFEHWLEPNPTPTPTPTPVSASLVDYVAVCGLANETQLRVEGDYTRYKISFEHAPDLTSARDALLLVTKEDDTATSDLMAQVDALTPPPSLLGQQRALDGDWKSNLAELGALREHLSQGVASLAQLVKLVRGQPRDAMTKRSADARERLLRLGRPGCRLNSEAVTPNVDWSPALRREWAVVAPQRTSPETSTENASVASHDGQASGTQEALPEAAVALPDAAPPPVALTKPNPLIHTVIHETVLVKPAQAAVSPTETQPSTTTAP
jgi:hypothetical protein